MRGASRSVDTGERTKVTRLGLAFVTSLLLLNLEGRFLST